MNDVDISVPVQGICVTRTGESPVSRMTAHTLEGGQADLRFVSARLRRMLHAGVRVRTGDLDAFCEAWLKARGRPPNADIRGLNRAKRLGVELSQLLGTL